VALARKLFVNWHTRRRQKNDLSASLDPVETLGFLKYEQYPFEVVIVEPDSTSGGLNAFTRVPIADLTLKMAINDTLDDATPLAETSGGSWTKDTSRNVFIGTLSLNTAAMSSYITADKTPYFELEITDGTNRVKILQEDCAVALSLMPVTTTSPDPSRTYLDYNETLGIFVPRVMAAGESIVIPSPNGLHRRIIGCNDDGTARDDIETT
jgi:hypothetical protein